MTQGGYIQLTTVYFVAIAWLVAPIIFNPFPTWQDLINETKDFAFNWLFEPSYVNDTNHSDEKTQTWSEYWFQEDSAQALDGGKINFMALLSLGVWIIVAAFLFYPQVQCFTTNR